MSCNDILPEKMTDEAPKALSSINIDQMTGAYVANQRFVVGLMSESWISEERSRSKTSPRVIVQRKTQVMYVNNKRD